MSQVKEKILQLEQEEQRHRFTQNDLKTAKQSTSALQTDIKRLRNELNATKDKNKEQEEAIEKAKKWVKLMNGLLER